MKTYDVLIIGAGPAGGSAAKRCGELGLSTILLEEHKIIGEPLHCGECVSQICLDKLGDIPNSVIAKKVKGIKLYFPKNKIHYVDEKGAVVHKEKFEQWIIKTAKKAGAQIRLNTKVTTLKKLKNHWIVSTNNSRLKEIKTKLIIDGSGAQAVTSNLMGYNKKFDIVMGLQYKIEDIPQTDYLDFYLLPDYAPHGYLWMIPKEDGSANVGLVTIDGSKLKPLLDKFVKLKGWDKKNVTKVFGGPIPASGPVKNTVNDGLMLIGDAAGFTSPLFEGGTHLGIQSGLFAAKVAKKSIKNKDYSKKVLKEYYHLWHNEFPKYNKLVKGKDDIYSLSNKELAEFSDTMPKQLGKLTASDKLFVLKNLFKNKKMLTRKTFRIFNAFKYSRSKKYGW
jgi:digeranylgeranylglycerophospholipid reductase